MLTWYLYVKIAYSYILLKIAKLNKSKWETHESWNRGTDLRRVVVSSQEED